MSKEASMKSFGCWPPYRDKLVRWVINFSMSLIVARLILDSTLLRSLVKFNRVCWSVDFFFFKVVQGVTFKMTQKKISLIRYVFFWNNQQQTNHKTMKSSITRSKIALLRDAGKEVMEIARQLGLSRRTVYRHLKPQKRAVQKKGKESGGQEDGNKN